MSVRILIVLAIVCFTSTYAIAFDKLCVEESRQRQFGFLEDLASKSYIANEDKIRYLLALANHYDGSDALVDNTFRHQFPEFIYCGRTMREINLSLELQLGMSGPYCKPNDTTCQEYRINADPRKVNVYLKKASDIGSIEAKDRLAYRLKEGLGTPKNIKEALGLAIDTAKHGSTYGQYLSGLIYSEMDISIEPNRSILAYMWLNIAAASRKNTSDGFVFPHDLERTMTASEIQKAQELSTTCFNSQFQNCWSGH